MIDFIRVVLQGKHSRLSLIIHVKIQHFTCILFYVYQISLSLNFAFSRYQYTSKKTSRVFLEFKMAEQFYTETKWEIYIL